VVPSHLSTQHLYELTQLSTLLSALNTEKETVRYSVTHFTTHSVNSWEQSIKKITDRLNLSSFDKTLSWQKANYSFLLLLLLQFKVYYWTIDSKSDKACYCQLIMQMLRSMLYTSSNLLMITIQKVKDHKNDLLHTNHNIIYIYINVLYIIDYLKLFRKKKNEMFTF